MFFRLAPSIRIAIYYLLISTAWILISDQILVGYQTAKGLGFVALTALGLGYLIHRAWQARERSERRFQAVVEHAREMISIVAADGTRLYHSPAIQDVLGYESDDLIGHGVLEHAHPDDREMIRDFLTSMAAAPGTVGWINLRAFHADGSVRHLHMTATNLLDDPSVGGIVLNTQDVTDWKRSEAEIGRQLARLEALHEVDLAILENPQLQNTLDIVLKHVVDKLDVDAASVLIYDPDSQNLVFGRGIGFPDGVAPQTRALNKKGIAGKAMVLRQPRIVPNLSQSDEATPRMNPLIAEGYVGYAALPLIAKDQLQGVLELVSRRRLEPSSDWLVFANAMAAQTAIAVDSAQLVESLQMANEELEDVYDRTLEGWAAALEFRDDETEGHSRRVVDLTLRLARELGIDAAEMVHIRRGALLHDIGKIGVPDSILLKPGPLDEDEWAIMRRHPDYAYELLKPIPYLHPALDIPRYHHERWNGSGYPEGLSGQDIPLHARIFAIVDAYDALVSDRPYRKAWTEEAALQYIEEESGKLFDPDLSATFLRLIETGSAAPKAIDCLASSRQTGIQATGARRQPSRNNQNL